jgi:pyrimidine operon attenuation protein/uracil phosphoribosyltransferase
MEPKILINHRQTELIIHRFVLQLTEQHGNLENCAIIGLQPRGVELSRGLMQKLNELKPGHKARYGELDNTFFRDDIRRGEIHMPRPSRIDFSTENLNIVLVDDVLFTGRSIRAGIDALINFGRPARVELMVLVDRRYNRELPIAADYSGVVVDSRSTGEHVKVEWNSNQNQTWLLPNKNN